MAQTEESSHKAMTGAAAAVGAGSAAAIAAYNGHTEGIEYLSHAGDTLKEIVEPVFYDPEMTKSGASSLKEYARGNVDTAAHFLSGAGLSAAANKTLKPGNRTKALAAGLGAGVVGYGLLKEGVYEGALEAFDVSYESLKAASSPVDHVVEEAGDVELNADQEKDLKADTAGVLTERSLGSSPSPGCSDSDVEVEAELSEEEETELTEDVLEPGEEHLVDSCSTPGPQTPETPESPDYPEGPSGPGKSSAAV